MSTPDGGPAFPACDTIASDGNLISKSRPGMSLRDYLAAKAMAALIGDFETAQHICNTDPRYDEKNFAKVVAINAYEFADAMIAQSAEGM